MTQNNFNAEQTTIRTKVIKLCQQHPEAKKDYRTLLQYFWYYEDGLKQYVPREVLAQLTQPESITRAFRKAVEEGALVLDVADTVKRDEQQKLFHNYYGRIKK